MLDRIKKSSTRKVLQGKFVLRRKRDSMEAIVKHKVRLVVCGNQEEENLEESFSPVPDFSIVKLIIRIANRRGSHARHFDVRNAFLNGVLDRPVFVELLN